MQRKSCRPYAVDEGKDVERSSESDYMALESKFMGNVREVMTLKGRGRVGGVRSG